MSIKQIQIAAFTTTSRDKKLASILKTLALFTPKVKQSSVMDDGVSTQYFVSLKADNKPEDIYKLFVPQGYKKRGSSGLAKTLRQVGPGREYVTIGFWGPKGLAIVIGEYAPTAKVPV